MNNVESLPQQLDKGPRYLGICARDLQARQSLSTAQEITHQPAMWREAVAAIERARTDIDAWLLPKLRVPGVQVLFCGAGTSAFIGDTLAPWLNANYRSGSSVEFASINTTDLVASPSQFLAHDRPTVMVSFARSGDSPESVAAVELACQLLSQCYHLVVTCNPLGKLAQYCEKDPEAFCLLMPDGTNDRGFAMTSSYTSMLVSCLTIFSRDVSQLQGACAAAERVIQEQAPSVADIASQAFDRLVVLGAGALTGTAREAALKSLELAAGKLAVMSDTPLGFRHGPKIFVSPRTIIVMLMSGDPLTAKYDRDLLAELRSDGRAQQIVELSHETLLDAEASELDDAWRSLVYIVYCQMLAFLKSYQLGVSVDTPCPSGEVNRVVQGVTVHSYLGRES